MSNGRLVISHNICDWRLEEIGFCEECAEPLEVERGIALSDIFSYSACVVDVAISLFLPCL